MLARVRWNNVALAVVVAGVVGLVVGWPLLGGRSEVRLPPPVAEVAPSAPVAPTATASPRPSVRRAPRAREAPAARVVGRKAGRGGRVRRVREREVAQGRPARAAIPTVAPPAPPPAVAAPPAPAPAAPPAPAPAAPEFGGFER